MSAEQIDLDGIKARAEAAEAEVERLRDAYAEREQRWHWSLIRKQNAERWRKKAIAERDAANAKVSEVVAAVEAVADSIERVMAGPSTSLYSLADVPHDIRTALAPYRDTEEDSRG